MTSILSYIRKLSTVDWRMTNLVCINILFLLIFAFVLLKSIQINLDVKRKHGFILFENVSRLEGILKFVRLENKKNLLVIPIKLRDKNMK